MITFVHPDLYAFKLATEKDPHNGRNYQKIQVLTSDKLVQPKNPWLDSSDTNQETYQNGIVNRGEVLMPINMEIFRISAPVAAYEDTSDENLTSRVANIHFPMSIFATYRNARRPRIEIRCHRNGDDHANLYIVAFPFNGMLQKINTTKAIRIYSGSIQTSKKPFFYRAHKYRKILYLIIEVNKNIYNADHPHHMDSVDLDLESYAYFTDRESSERKTKHEKMHLKFLPNGEFETEWDEEVLDQLVDKHVEPDVELWPIFRLDRKDDEQTAKPASKRKHGKKEQPQVRIEGNMFVTTNKYGIRVERTIRNHQNPHGGGGRSNSNREYRSRTPRNEEYPRSYRENRRDKDIDQMIKESGMNDKKNPNRSRKNGGKPQRGGGRHKR